MKLAKDLTITEIRHLIGVAPISEAEIYAYEEKLYQVEQVAFTMLRLIETHVPEHRHTCPQCRNPKKKKEPEPQFSLD